MNDMQTKLEPVSRDNFRAAMSLVPHAVYIVTTDGVEGRAGLTATAVSSVSADPPCLLVCLNAANASTQTFYKNMKLAVNSLGAEQESLANMFASADKQFNDENWHFASSPILKNARCVFECEIAEVKLVNTHLIVFANVLNVVLGDAAQSLVYMERGYRAV